MTILKMELVIVVKRMRSMEENELGASYMDELNWCDQRGFEN